MSPGRNDSPLTPPICLPPRPVTHFQSGLYLSYPPQSTVLSAARSGRSACPVRCRAQSPLENEMTFSLFETGAAAFVEQPEYIETCRRRLPPVWRWSRSGFQMRSCKASETGTTRMGFWWQRKGHKIVQRKLKTTRNTTSFLSTPRSEYADSPTLDLISILKERK